MSAKKEFSAGSLKEAIAEAAREYNTEESNIKYEIVTGKTRYFGHKNRSICILAWASKGDEVKALTEFVGLLINHLGADLDFEIKTGDEYLKVNFSGRDYRLLLYQNGNLLNAVQYIINRLFSDEIGKKIYCESENFRKNREKELTSLAHRYSKDVRREGKTISIKELNPFERRIVHMTVSKYPDLESISDGDNFLKVITIKKKNG